MAASPSQIEPVAAPPAPAAPSRWLGWGADLAALLVLLAIGLLVHASGLLGGPVFYERDTSLFYYPLTDWFGEQLRQGRLPLWLPLIFGGYPLLADGEVGPLYPLHLLSLPFVPLEQALVPLRTLHTLLAGGLTYLLLRVLGGGRAGALVGGLVFALGSFLVSQLHHENMIRSAVWLPGQLALLELAFRSRGWARQRWLVGCGLLIGIACLGLHVQAVAMSLMALGLYAVVRLGLGPWAEPLRERLALLVWGPGLAAALAVGLSAAQWLPLFELGRTSFRGPGLRYDLATTYSLAPANLPALIFPYFFRAADGQWWSLWAPWETLPYVGIAPLALAGLGLLLARRRAVVYFGLLALFGLWLAMSHYAPFNLHELLWRLPGVSSLRAPGRFSFLFVFGVAGLAAFGLDELLRGRRRWPLLAFGLLLPVAAVAFALVGQVVTWRFLADPGYGQQVAELRYLSLRHQNPDLAPHQVYEGLLYSLQLTNPKTALGLGLLVAAGGLLVACWWRPARARRWAVGLVGLVALDLVLFALDYHPAAPLRELTALPPVAQVLAERATGERTFVEPVLSRLEPNRLVLARAWELNGYSSLQSQRHWEYFNSVDKQENRLFDLWNGRYYVVPARRTDVIVERGTAFRPYELLMFGGAGNPNGRERFQIEPFLTGEVRVLAALANALDLPQGEVVAELTLVGAGGQRFSAPLRAGLELSEHAIDRSDVAPLAAHQRATVVHGLPDATPSGQPFTSNVYYASLRPPAAFAVREIEVRYVAPSGYLMLWGVGLVEPGSGRVRSLFADDKAKYEHPPLYRDDEAVVYRNAQAFPRAYVVPAALARRTRTEQTAIARMALRPFDPDRQAVLEEGPFDDLPLAADQLADDELDRAPAAAEVTDLDPTRLLVRANGPGVLVLNDTYHRGWRAYLDGREAPVYLANYLSRAVGLPAGPQQVEFVFDPLSWRLGLAVSGAAGLFALAVLSSVWWARRRPGERLEPD